MSLFFAVAATWVAALVTLAGSGSAFAASMLVWPCANVIELAAKINASRTIKTSGLIFVCGGCVSNMNGCLMSDFCD